MVPSILHLVVAAILAGLTVEALRTFARDRRSYTLIVAAVGVGLVYDNAMLGLGRWIGHGAVLEAWSVPRFAIHALITPLLVVAGFGAARAFGLRWAQDARAHAAACTLATALVAWGVVTDIVRLDLEAKDDGGIISYSNAAASLPVPAMTTILALIAIGVVLWRAQRWPWLAAGAAVMFVASGLGSISGLLTNVGELSLIASLLATEKRAGRAIAERPTAGREVDLGPDLRDRITRTIGGHEVSGTAARRPHV